VTTSQKAALSLLISVAVVAIFSVLAFTGFYNFIETRFYNPSITNSVTKEAQRDAETIENYFDELQSRFEAILKDDAVKRSFLPNQAARDIFERSRLFSMLLESERGLQSVRFIDGGGIRLHFSTNPADVFNQTSDSISYKNYDEVTPFVPYSELEVSSEGAAKIALDGQNDRIIFSFPFLDGLNIYRGTAIFSLSTRAVVDRLIMEGRIKVGEDVSIVSNPPGLVSGLPNFGREASLAVISKVWQDGIFRFVNLDSSESSTALALVSAKTSQGLIIGRVVSESLFAFPQSMKIILFITLFLTVFLTVFLFFNIQPDTITVIQNRLKGLQLSLIRDYYERKGEIDWNRWYYELEQRREDVRSEIKRGITNKPAALLEDIDSLIDKSWDEILAAIGGRRETRLAIDEDKLQNILNRMLVAAGNMPGMPMAGTKPPVMPGVPVTPAAPAAPVAQGVTVDEQPVPALTEFKTSAQDADDADDVEELEELTDEDEFFAEGFTDIAPTADVESIIAYPDEEAEELEEFDDIEELPAADSEPDDVPFGVPFGGAKQLTTEDLAMVDTIAANEIDALIANAEEIENTIPLKSKPEKSGAGESEVDLIPDGEGVPVFTEAVEDLGELEELEEIEESAVTDTDFSITVGPDHADIASKIEFSPSAKEEETPQDLNTNVEIVSPFSGFDSRFSDSKKVKPSAHDDSNETKTSGRLEELDDDFSMSLVYQPFRNEITSDPQELSSVTSGVITHKNGIDYVNSKVKNPDSESTKALDPGLKNLVDSVIGKK